MKAPARPSLALAAAILLAVAAPAEPRRHLFLDPDFLQEHRGVEWRVTPPEKREAVLRPEHPWENLMVGFFVTVRDEDGILRMWYMCGDRDGQKRRSYPIAYAESADGIHWRKPVLGLAEHQGSRANNLTGLWSWEGVVFRDPNGRGDRRYLYVTNVDGEGVVRFFSPDGLRWQRDAQPLLPFRADTQNVVYWDEDAARYVLYLRAWDMAPGWNNRLRVVGRLTATSLDAPLPVVPSGRGNNPGNPKDRPRIAGEIPAVFAADARDPAATDVYNFSVQPYPVDRRWLLAFPSFYRHFPGGTAANDGKLEVHFAGGRDGVAWHRYDRAPYLRLGPEGADDSSVAYMGTGMVVRGEEIWQYGTVYRTTHKVEGRERPTDGTVYRFVQRIDGFVALAFPQDGMAQTRAIRPDGPRCFINLDTGALGEVRVGFYGADGRAVPGFAIEDCDPIRTNSTRARVTWKGAGDTNSLLGRDVSVRLEGRRARVFSFFFD